MKILILALTIIASINCKIRGEDSIFWPIRAPVDVEETDRIAGFKKLNIGLGV
jgi:hypothetical protein